MLSSFFSENRAVYVTTSKNLVEPETRQTTIWRRVACWISKATRAQARANAHAHTHTHVNTCAHINMQDIAFLLQQLLFG
jgi:dynactin complex subunit